MQSRVASFVESLLNVGSGFFLSLVVWVGVIAPWFNIQVTWADNLTITAIFTILSIVRGYFWRRFFANQLHRRLLR